MVVSGQIHAPSLEKVPPATFALQGIGWTPEWVWTISRKASCFCWECNSDSLAFEAIAQSYLVHCGGLEL
jgi:hypothetical protein